MQRLLVLPEALKFHQFHSFLSLFNLPDQAYIVLCYKVISEVIDFSDTHL